MARLRLTLPSLGLEGGSPAIWLKIDVSVRKRVLETHGPKTRAEAREESELSYKTEHLSAVFGSTTPVTPDVAFGSRSSAI